jgi:hypothetical protein
MPAMKLDLYKVKLIRYPDLPECIPFWGWDPAKPTQSLPWYDAYNSVKHDREGAFARATLEHAIEAVAACVVMLAAQFGYEKLEQYGLKNVFQFKDIPKWEPKDWYYGPIPQVDWQAVNYPL